MLEKNASNRSIQQHVESRYGKKITRKDINNILRRKKPENLRKNFLEELVIQMEKISGSKNFANC